MDYIIVILVLIFGFSLKSRYSQLGSKEHILLDQLFFYHMIMSFVFYIYLNTMGGDARLYWLGVKVSDIDEIWTPIITGKASATHYMFLINYIPSNLLDLSFFTGCILYGVLGYWGIVFLVVTLKELFPLLNSLKQIKILNFPIYPSIFFLPNFHFWSSGVGKDTLLFFCACAFFYALMNLRKRWFVMIVVIAIAYPIRPHILLFLLAGFGVAYVLKSKLFLFQKIVVVGFAFVLFLPLLSNVLEFANVEEASLESYGQFSESSAGNLSKGAGSGVDISALPYPLQVLTFLYRPLFFDATNILAIFASVENVVWIILSITFFRNNPFKVFIHSHMLILATFLYWLIGALAFAPILGNLGIIIRERNMFLPGFIIFAVAGLYNTKNFRKFEWFYNQEREKHVEQERNKLLEVKETIT